MKLAVQQITDEYARDNFQKIQDFLNSLPLSQERFRAIELFVTADVAELKINHGLGFIPLDVLATRLVAPSGAKLTFLYSKFTAQDLYLTISGLSGVLSARLLVGAFQNVTTISEQPRESNESQELKSKV